MTLTASHRATTSSRRPGVVIRGTVYIRRAELHTCAKCGGLTFFSEPHSPRWTDRPSGHVQIDCAGDEVTP